MKRSYATMLAALIVASGCNIGFNPERAGGRFPTDEERQSGEPGYLCPVTYDDFKVLGPGRVAMYGGDSPHTIVTNTWTEPDGTHAAFWTSDDTVSEYVFSDSPNENAYEILYKKGVKEVRGANNTRQPSGGPGRRVLCYPNGGALAGTFPEGQLGRGIVGATTSKLDFQREAPPETQWIIARCSSDMPIMKLFAVLQTKDGWTLHTQHPLVDAGSFPVGPTDVLSVVSGDKSPAPFAGGTFEFVIAGTAKITYNVPKLAPGAVGTVDVQWAPQPTSPRNPEVSDVHCVAEPFNEQRK